MCADRERGQASSEYVGAVALVATILAAVLLTGVAARVSGGLSEAVCWILGREDCGTAEEVAAGDTGGEAAGSDEGEEELTDQEVIDAYICAGMSCVDVQDNLNDQVVADALCEMLQPMPCTSITGSLGELADSLDEINAVVIDVLIGDYQRCWNDPALSIDCASVALDLVPVVGKLDNVNDARRAIAAGFDAAEDGADGAAAARRAVCSFGATTPVLMADGTTKPIATIAVGDRVLAEEPLSGERRARPVTAVWVHEDTLRRLRIDGDAVVTTEDHRFWNETDRAWQPAADLDPGDRVRTATGQHLAVEGFDEASASVEAAYNLTVAGLHTYYVGVGGDQALVHNDCGRYVESPKHHPNAPSGVNPAPTNGQAALDASIQMKDTSPRRVAYEPDAGEYVVLDQTSEGVYHGHVREWDELTQEMKNALVGAGVVDRRGRPL